jgi:hypothetical protein
LKKLQAVPLNGRLYARLPFHLAEYRRHGTKHPGASGNSFRFASPGGGKPVYGFLMPSWTVQALFVSFPLNVKAHLFSASYAAKGMMTA